MATSPDLLVEDVELLGRDFFAYKLYFAGASALLIYDYLLTWADEVEYAWKEKKGLVFYLFIINRYFALAFCIITLFAYFSPLFTFEICDRFAIVEWLQALIIAITAEAVLVIRVHALTRHRCTVLLLGLIMVAQCAVVFAAMSDSNLNGALHLPDVDIEPFHICVLYSDLKMDIAYLSLSILFDVIVFGLTIYLTFNTNNKFNALALSTPKTSLLQTIQRDGLLYFCSILSGNLVWLLMVLFSRPGIKFINAQPSMMITSIMINRLTLSLRRVNRKTISWQPSPTNWDDCEFPEFSTEMSFISPPGTETQKERERDNRDIHNS